MKKLMTRKEYLSRCVENCSSRIDPKFFKSDALQKNALRSESMRDNTAYRCGEKIPETWPDGAKNRGWSRWVYSGGSPSVFGFCDTQCPLVKFYLKSAPLKKLRDMAND